MAGEDQERFEDYLELERYISDLQAGRAAHPPRDLTPAQARVYRMAAFFRSAPPDNGELRPEFAQDLHARLLSLAQTTGTEGHQEESAQAALPGPNTSEQSTMASPEPDHAPTPPQVHAPKRVRFFSRRSLLTGTVAAASLAVGVGVTSLVERQPAAPTSPGPATDYGTPTDLVTGPTTRLFVTTLAQLGQQAVKFVADTVVGYVILHDSDHPGDPDNGKVIAMSAACTHMGCIVNWDSSDQQFHCPCHGGLFDEYGKPAKGSPVQYLRALPRLTTHVDEHGNIYVEVPAPPTKSNA